MMNNSIKYVQVETRMLCKALGITDPFKKDMTLKLAARKKLEEKLKKIIYSNPEYNYMFEMVIPQFNSCIRLVYDWDKIKLPRINAYENVYVFDSRFIPDVLTPMTDWLQELTGILWCAY